MARTLNNYVRAWSERLRGLPILPVPYGAEHSDLAPYVEKLAAQVDGRTREPLAVLTASQVDFDARWDELERTRYEIGELEFFRRSQMLAAELWRAGGRRRAATAFSGRISFQGHDLLAVEYVGFALDAAEWLLEDDLASLAAHHLAQISGRLGAVAIPPEQRARLQQLRVRCMDALCAYTDVLHAIDEAIPEATPNERARLEAERCEIHLLQGDFALATSERD
jgi:hypothetical protein